MRQKLALAAIVGALMALAGNALAGGHPGPGNSGNCASPDPPASCPNHH